MNVDEVFKELAQYQRILEETSVIVDNLKNAVKDYMTDKGIEELVGTEHKATYKTVNGTKVDTKRLKEEHPRIAKQYIVANPYKQLRFS